MHNAFWMPAGPLLAMLILQYLDACLPGVT